jgi:hypothetical protein
MLIARNNFPLDQTAVLEFLTTKVRLIADYQLATRSKSSSRAFLQRLAGRGLITLRRAMVHPEIPLDKPAFVWRPGDAAPNFDRIAWGLRSRWKLRPLDTVVAVATYKARHCFGGVIGGRPIRRTEICHDLHVTALYLKLCRESPELARLWIHEDELSCNCHHRTQVPDAIIGERAIDFGGRYQAAKLRTMHRGYAADLRPYEIW